MSVINAGPLQTAGGQLTVQLTLGSTALTFSADTDYDAPLLSVSEIDYEMIDEENILWPSAVTLTFKDRQGWLYQAMRAKRDMSLVNSVFGLPYGVISRNGLPWYSGNVDLQSLDFDHTNRRTSFTLLDGFALFKHQAFWDSSSADINPYGFVSNTLYRFQDVIDSLISHIDTGSSGSLAVIHDWVFTNTNGDTCGLADVMFKAYNYIWSSGWPNTITAADILKDLAQTFGVYIGADDKAHYFARKISSVVAGETIVSLANQTNEQASRSLNLQPWPNLVLTTKGGAPQTNPTNKLATISDTTKIDLKLQISDLSYNGFTVASITDPILGTFSDLVGALGVFLSHYRWIPREKYSFKASGVDFSMANFYQHASQPFGIFRAVSMKKIPQEGNTEFLFQEVAPNGGALSFNGVSAQYGTVPHDARLDAFPITIEFYAKLAAGAAGHVISKYTASPQSGFGVRFEGGTMLHAWYYADSANYVDNVASEVAWSAVNWAHVAVVVDSASMRIYVDGVLTSTTAWTGTPSACSSVADMLVGIEQGLTFPLAGQLDELRIWNVARPLDQIQLFMKRRLINYVDYTTNEDNAGLLVYCQFDEGGGAGSAAGGNIAHDGSGNGIDMRIIGSPSWVQGAI